MRMSSGPVVAVGEAPLGPVELRRRDPEVEEDAGDGVDPELGHDGVEVVEPSVPQGDPVAEGGEDRGGRRQRRRVPVDPDQREVGPGLEQQPGVAATADRGVHQRPRPGTGRKSSTIRSAITGTWWKSVMHGHLGSVIVTSGDPWLAHLQPPGRRLPPGCLPD